MILQIPLTNDGAQQFITQLGSAKYQFNFRFNERSANWVMDISDPVLLTPIINSVPVVLGTDLIKPFNLGIGQLVVNDDDSTGLDAGPNDLGVRISMYWSSP